MPSGDVCPTVGHQAGSIYSFRTAPFSKHSPPETDRFAAIKILAANEQYVAVAVLDGIWNEPPSFSQACECSILEEHRFASNGRLAAIGVNTEWWDVSALREARFLGVAELTANEWKLGERITSHSIGIPYSTINSVNYAAEGEWRWKHDRIALKSEIDRVIAEEEAERAAEEKRYQARLRSLTWDQLLSETPFERWSPSPPFPPEHFTAGARKAIHDACRSLKALGPKPRKADVRTVLRRCVEWFNEEDRRAGRVIETEEREDICQVLAELAFVTHQRSLVDEIDQWREW
jgi:hypothetical protein